MGNKIGFSQMTSKERMMCAMKGNIPDRVPVAPDISNMVPTRLTGKPFWEIYVNKNPLLGHAYMDAVRYYGMDGWYIYGHIDYKQKIDLETENKIEKYNDHWIINNIVKTPDGDLHSADYIGIGDPPTQTEKYIKDFKRDFKKIRWLFQPITNYDKSQYLEDAKIVGNDAVMCFGAFTPGFHTFLGLFNGNLEAVVYAYYDEPELFAELCEMYEKRELQKLDILLDNKVDSVLTGGSGAITLQSMDIWRKISLPALKKITRACKEAGVISGIHTCGLEREMTEICANETDINYINPLEIPPMGDCNLADLKKSCGDKICLMGNIHTTDTMLIGTADDVRRESLRAIRDAGDNGGFILSTGDQCGRDTPDENIFAMVNTAKEYGKYPLNLNLIKDEIKKYK
jgi:uroporphyrinogen decarboxylase